MSVKWKMFLKPLETNRRNLRNEGETGRNGKQPTYFSRKLKPPFWLVCLRGNALILSIDGPIAALRAARRSGFRLSGSFAWRFGAACSRLINAVHVARAQRPAVHTQRGKRFHRDGGGQRQLLLVLNTATCGTYRARLLASSLLMVQEAVQYASALDLSSSIFFRRMRLASTPGL